MGRRTPIEPERVAVQAVEALGRGFDLNSDFRLKFCKGDAGSRLIYIEERRKQDLVIPGGPLISNVSSDIKCDKGERIRFKSDVLEFNKMSELFNQRSSIQGKIPSGFFNSMYTFSGSWLQDATETKHLAFDGHLISLYNLHLTRTPLLLREEIKNAVPADWEPAKIARFIEKFGTHIIVGVEVGGQDMVFVRQSHSSSIPPAELKRHLENLGDQLFSEDYSPSRPHFHKRENREKVPEVFNNILQSTNPVHLGSFSCSSSKDGLTIICSKRGGLVSLRCHSDWLQTIQGHPDAILFSLVPISSLLQGVAGSGFLSHAINLYLRYKPSIDDLQYFLEFQVPRQWAPFYSELPLGPSRRKVSFPSLQFSFMGPKLHVSTAQVSVGRRPVIGLRLYLEGKKCNRLAMHLQHLSSLPRVLQPYWDDNIFVEPSRWHGSDESHSQYFEPVHWKHYSHVCTVAIKYDPSWVQGTGGVFVVTGAQLQVKGSWSRSVLHLKLQFTRLPNCTIQKSVWGHAPAVSQRSRFLSTLSSTFSMTSAPPKPVPVVLNSGVYPNGPPVPVQSQKLLKFVDTTEVSKGPQDTPGHWLVTAAKLDIDRGKISLQVKFSLLNYCT
uniref:MACPF domain-containing protein n=1 Tax=Araucaria cunninghamii TaxID=56994 RepID=A0A0D6QYC1_ARACU